MIREATVRQLVDELAHLLPAQRPLEAFVHHNTLHHFEHLPFQEGVEAAADIFGAQPYMSEASFRDAWQNGRILVSDLDEAVQTQVPNTEVRVGALTHSLRDVVRTWMRFLPEGDGGATLRWRLEETDELARWPADLPRGAFERLSSAGPAHTVQPALWRAISRAVPASATMTRPARPRDAALAGSFEDPDGFVNPAMIRWCGAFLDGGHAYWPMADRDGGFYRAVLAHLNATGASGKAWMRPLTGRAQLLVSAGTSPERCIAETLERMGCPAAEVEDLLRETLLSLPGWAGMFIQLAARPDLAPAPPPPTDLADFVAIRLLLDEAAARWVMGCGPGPIPCTSVAVPADPERPWILFNAARWLGVCPQDVSDSLVRDLDALLTRYDSIRRRWIWQLAYERRYRIGILDSVIHHARRVASDQPPAAKVQLVTCIDDREESFRRHFEEISPHNQTFGLAGFFGVTVYHRPLGEPHQRPLCPANTVPKHLLKEVPADLSEWDRLRLSRGRIGRVAEALSVGSDTLFRGGLISLWGWSSIVPLVTRILAPRLHGRTTAASRPSPRTRLQLEATSEEKDHGLQVGFSADEMVNIVRRSLQDMGLTRAFAPLVFVLGHGSRSLNNPHEAAHDCGACGGGRGGPNARAFAQMANRPDVRAALDQSGIEIPSQTWFVGGYHNTCDGAVDLYDLDVVPAALGDALQAARRDLDTARTLDVHERIRRFESADLRLSPQEALAHVETRAEDLAQPRPEYGHCTNALCILGRRSWNRGLYLDRRAFLTSYDPAIDPDGLILERLLAMVGPVGAGINLEYYFSFVDPDRYGSNTKLPHNITALLGVMDGHSSDLRTGLPWQMVEIHEPVRLLNVIEARPEQLLAILERQPALRTLVVNRWILVAAFEPETQQMW
ncbi:MAG: hypothetical protein ACI855_004550, partial [Myxococcota bacterium]